MEKAVGNILVRAARVSALAIVLAAASLPAAAQLEIGGKPFDNSSAAAPTPATTTATQSNNLTAMVQRDLTTLGYAPGAVTGEMNVTTAVAISKFQAENELEVTGEVSPQLAGILSAKVGATSGGTTGTTVAASATNGNQAPAEATHCAQGQPDPEAQERARETGRLARAGGRLLSRLGRHEAAQEVNQAVGTAGDLAEIADAAGDLVSDCDP
jgi:peptidoglycan hydrolase-like protein with peptidoglycan-binding domain